MMSYPVQLTTDSNTRQVECDGVHLLSLVVAGEQGAGDEIDFVFHSAEDCAGAVSLCPRCCRRHLADRATAVGDDALLRDSRP